MRYSGTRKPVSLATMLHEDPIVELEANLPRLLSGDIWRQQ